ncbi:MAG: hypothetical protein IPG50_17100 [Myxococcales bacterium]|nr:hypothetical protein [Myxococcales bacterium]
MDRVLLDTDIFSEIFKQRDATVAARALAYQTARGAFTISVITAMEITSGLHRIRRRNSSRASRPCCEGPRVVELLDRRDEDDAGGPRASGFRCRLMAERSLRNIGRS